MRHFIEINTPIATRRRVDSMPKLMEFRPSGARARAGPVKGILSPRSRRKDTVTNLVD